MFLGSKIDWALVCVFWCWYLCVNVWKKGAKSRICSCISFRSGCYHVTLLLPLLSSATSSYPKHTKKVSRDTTKPELLKKKGVDKSRAHPLFLSPKKTNKCTGKTISTYINGGCPTCPAPLPVCLSAHRGRLSSAFQGPSWAGGAPCSDEPVGLMDYITHTHTLAQSVIISIYRDSTFRFAVLSINCLLCSPSIRFLNIPKNDFEPK